MPFLYITLLARTPCLVAGAESHFLGKRFDPGTHENTVSGLHSASWGMQSNNGNYLFSAENA